MIAAPLLSSSHVPSSESSNGLNPAERGALSSQEASTGTREVLGTQGASELMDAETSHTPPIATGASIAAMHSHSQQSASNSESGGVAPSAEADHLSTEECPQDEESLGTILDESSGDDIDNPKFGPILNDDEDSSAQKKTHITLPTWLQKRYSDICSELNRLKEQEKLPPCYEQGTFIMPMKVLIFNLKDVIQLEPLIFYHLEFFVWFPHLLVNCIPCPACRAAGRRCKSDGQPVVLRLHSLPQSPRHIIDLEYNTYIIGQRYYCDHKECGKSYLSWSPAIMDILSPVVTSQFTFYLTGRCGISDRVLELLCHCFQYSVGPLPFLELLRHNHLAFYEKRHWLYLSMIEHRKQTPYFSQLALFKQYGDAPDGLLSTGEHTQQWENSW
ncbi:hypothetical protein EUX98_g5541 [Antrodiella citrinella]|uniref:DUF6729 domain-containing protein n=1 Tax=Antrodiella citrinella TaxID=2447956 RepID=A0A4S4MTH9_9APHY|nr:hypothetical protein EUX98_g5541 [Antrodiella citrinella]